MDIADNDGAGMAVDDYSDHNEMELGLQQSSMKMVVIVDPRGWEVIVLVVVGDWQTAAVVDNWRMIQHVYRVDGVCELLARSDVALFSYFSQHTLHFASLSFVAEKISEWYIYDDWTIHVVEYSIHQSCAEYDKFEENCDF